VTAQQWTGQTGVDESFAGQMHYSNGQVAQIYGAFSVPFYTLTEIHGTKGRITITKPYTGSNEPDSEITMTPSQGEPQKLRIAPIDSYLAEVENMHAAILDGASTLISLEESRNHVRTACALYEAARTGQMVKVI
jgi:predicted dehydrogenase